VPNGTGLLNLQGMHLQVWHFLSVHVNIDQLNLFINNLYAPIWRLFLSLLICEKSIVRIHKSHQ
jgi:hypothetical protein